MILTKFRTTRRLIGENRGHHKRYLWREHSYALRRRVMVEMVPIIVPDIQDSLWRDTHSVVGKDLISSYHLEQRDLGGTERHSRTEMLIYRKVSMMDSVIVGYICIQCSNTEASCHVSNVINASIHKCLNSRNIAGGR